MRILRLRIPAFGPLADFDTGPDPLPDRVVVLGDNEAGKSSLVEAIRSLLHGLYPAARDRHPLAPWNGADAEIEGWVRGRNGTTWRVHRRLLSTPWGRLEVEGSEGEEDLGNASIPPVLHVDRDAYRQVHTVTLPELVRLDQAPAWTGLRDRILAGMASEEMAPPRVVAASLEREASSLWRAKRARGSRDHALGEALQAASEALREARERDRVLREAREERAQAAEKRSTLRRRIALLDARIEEARELTPVRRRLERLEALRAQAGDLSELAGLPMSPMEHLRALEDAEARARHALAEAEEACRATAGGVFSPGAEGATPGGSEDGASMAREAASVEDGASLDEAWAALEGELRAIRDAAALLRQGAERLADRAREESEAGAALAEAARPLLLEGEEAMGRPVDPEGDGDIVTEGALGADTGPGKYAALEARAGGVAHLPLAELRLALRAREDARRARTEAHSRFEARRRMPPPTHPRARPGSTLPLLGGMALLLALAAVAFLVAGRGTPGVGALVLGGALALALVAARVHAGDRAADAAYRERADVDARERAEAESVLEGARAHAAETEQRVSRLLGDLPLRPVLLDEGGESLASSLERLADRLVELLRRRETRREEEARLGAQRDALIRRVAGHTLLEGGDALFFAPPFEAGTPGGWVALAEGWVSRADAWLHRASEARARIGARAEAARKARAAEEALDAARLQFGAAEAAREAFTATLPREAGQDALDEEGLARHTEARLAAAREAAALTRDLEATHGPLPELQVRLEAAGTRPEATAEGLALVLEERVGLAEALEGADDRFHRAEARLAESGRAATPDQVESGIEALREEREALRIDRDRLMLLARITAHAEQRFREAHQPQLIRRAESTLADLTQGRYDTLVLGTPSDPGALQVRGRDTPGSLPVDLPLSTGTREQIWFALRLAVVGMAEGGGEPLPLVLDEVFVNWDAGRRGAALDALGGGEEGRQVFLVTCHPFLAREAEARGARVVTLPAPRTELRR